MASQSITVPEGENPTLLLYKNYVNIKSKVLNSKASGGAVDKFLTGLTALIMVRTPNKREYMNKDQFQR